MNSIFFCEASFFGFFFHPGRNCRQKHASPPVPHLDLQPTATERLAAMKGSAGQPAKQAKREQLDLLATLTRSIRAERAAKILDICEILYLFIYFAVL